MTPRPFLSLALFACMLVGCVDGEIGSSDQQTELAPAVDPGGDSAVDADPGESSAFDPALDSGASDAAPSLDDAPASDAAPAPAPDAAAPAPDTTPPPGPVDTGPPLGPPPPPLPGYSKGACPTLGPINAGFASGSDTREFRLVVPPSYDGKSDWPLVVGYHWLGSSAAALVSDGELASAAEQMHFLVAVPDRLTVGGTKAYKFDWPFYELGSAPNELVFFDDMLACVSAQYRIDRRRIYVMGVSAGALWTTYLSTTSHVQWVAAIETLSGGLGSLYTWKMDWAPQPNKFPALVLWGGPTDKLGIDFNVASQAYADALVGDGHFLVTCVHDKGHSMPPIPVPADGTTRLRPLWQFLLDHPYGLAAGSSPYQTTGLPAVYPSWCKLGK